MEWKVLNVRTIENTEFQQINFPKEHSFLKKLGQEYPQKKYRGLKLKIKTRMVIKMPFDKSNKQLFLFAFFAS